MAARIPLASQRLVVVTGKGGVGKSAVTAALARAAANAGRRVLAVEVGHGRLGRLLGARALGPVPTKVSAGLTAVSIEPAEALGDFLLGVLRLKVLARRLLESTSFQVLAAALPGLADFLVLHTLANWLDARRLGRPIHDLVIVDAPASGHSLPLLAAPRTLAALVPLGPFASMVTRLDRMLVDPATTLVCLVTTPEELAVRETIELHRELQRLGVAVAPPIVNALPPRLFRPADEPALAHLEAVPEWRPYLVAARFEQVRTRAAAAQVTALRRALGTAPVRLPFLFAGPEAADGLARLTDDLAVATGFAA